MGSAMYLLIAVTDRKRADKFQLLFRECRIAVVHMLLGRGTATSEILDYLNLEAGEKSVLLAAATKSTLGPLLKACRDQLYIDIPGNGIVATIPINSVGGRGSLAVLAQNQELTIEEKGEGENTVIQTKYELIFVIANEGNTDLIMDAARGANAGGGTVVKAKGTGGKLAKRFLGLSIADEKEIILIVSPVADRNAIMKAIMDKAGADSKAKSIVFSIPVSSVAGLRSLE